MSTKKTFFIMRAEGGERALLLQYAVYQGEHVIGFEEALDEFRLLAESAGADCIEVVTGKLAAVSPKYFVGEGKLAEIASLIKAAHIDVVLMNHSLSPAQVRNLEQYLTCRVCDRAELILDIFAQRARTHEGQLQVELAQLEHASTRLVRGWTHLERQKGGIGLRGPGETQLESDRRLVAGRIKYIKKRLEKVVMQRAQSRRARDRASVPVISLVGYTNAGKSTLFNRITDAERYVANQLFATLDTTCRRFSLPKIGQVIFADTVGFVRELPHELIAAFKATLEETREADLLLQVVDASTVHVNDTIETVNAVLTDIGAGQVPQLLVMNKVDLLPNTKPRIDYDQQGLPKRIWISAQQGIGLDLLLETIVSLLSHQMLRCQLTLTPQQGRLRAKLFALGVVLSEKNDNDGNCILDLEIQKIDLERALCQAQKTSLS